MTGDMVTAFFYGFLMPIPLYCALGIFITLKCGLRSTLDDVDND